MGKKVDLAGRIFSRLTVTGEADARYVLRAGVRTRQRLWLCVCDCGSKTVLSGDALVSGNTKSCGCLNLDKLVARSTTHGHKPRTGMSRTYRIWLGMLERCLYKTSRDYAGWGGRGIKVCDRWRKFAAFLEDMGEAPVGLSLDRRDNNGNYNKQNCRWATCKEQHNNKRSNRVLDYAGESLTVSQWAERTGIHKSALRYRLEAGWSIEEALTTKVNYSNNLKRKESK